MTKIHEQLIRGSIQDVATHADVVNPQGEFTVVLLPADESAAAGTATDQAVWDEFCYLTKDEGLNRREAVTLTARRLGVATREAYAALERHKLIRQAVEQV
jgi:16S rRNA C1402 (ribose-2'-O) methylase RsmI